MVNSEQLSNAVAAGVLDAQQAERLSRYLGTEAQVDPDDENFKLIGGFNDIFVTIGLVLVFGALAGLMGAGMPFAGMFVAWGLAEIFTRKRRMALPSIFLSFAFVCSIAGSAAILIGGTGRYTYASLYISLLPVGAIICAILAACFHYWRFRVAIDVTIAVAGLASLTLLILHRVAPETGAMLERWLAFALGLAIFAFAMRFDLADPRRVTHRGDIAFWLHLLAAQLIVHGLFRGFEGVASFFSKDATAAHAPVIIAVTLAFILVALLIDRRALIVSALSYAGVALWALVSGHGIPKGEAVSLTLLMLGAMILALSIGWRPLRRLIVPRLPLRGLVSRLPPVEKSS